MQSLRDPREEQEMRSSFMMGCIARWRWSWQGSGIISLLLSIFMSLPLAAQSTPAIMTSPIPGSAISGNSATFSWSAGSGVPGYRLIAGNALRASNVFSHS